MAIELRVCLLLGSVLTLVYMFGQIRKSHMQIDYAIFWTLFGIGIFLLGLFPRIAGWASAVLGVQSPANLVYLLIIFVLLLKEFSTTLKISKLDQKITELTQSVTLKDFQKESERETRLDK